MFHPVLRYQGSVVSRPILGDPRVVGLAFLGLIALAFVVAIVAGAIDLNALGAGGLVLAAGPIVGNEATNSTGWKELAAQKFLEAHRLEDADGNVASEQQGTYDALVAEGLEAETKAGEAAKREGTRETARERFGFYHGKGTGGEQMRFAVVAADAQGAASLGAQFVESETYKALLASGALDSPNRSFSTAPVSFLTPRGQIGAAASDILHTEGDTPTIAAPAAVRLPGVYGLGQLPLTVRDVFPNEGDPGSDVIEFVKQTSADKASGRITVKQSTSASDAAGLKKQSAAGTQVETAHAEIVATWFAATRKSIALPNALRSFIDNQGRYFLRLEEEYQLVNGDGTRPNLSGLLDQDDRLHLDISAVGGVDNLDGLRVAKRVVRQGLSKLPANFVLVNPVDSQWYDLLKDNNGLYRGGNPIGPGFAAGELPIWRLKRVETEEVAEGKALVGASVMATVFQRAPVRVLVADQHSDFFVRNLVVVLFEEEIAFPIYFPTALCEVELEDFQIGS